jgi:hypothetical protein
MNPPLIWYQLFEENVGEAGSIACITQIPANAFLFCEVVIGKNPTKLSHVDASDLVVYANSAAFHSNPQTPLNPTAPVAGLGFDENALYVVFPKKKGFNDFNYRNSKAR